MRTNPIQNARYRVVEAVWQYNTRVKCENCSSRFEFNLSDIEKAYTQDNGGVLIDEHCPICGEPDKLIMEN